jgi:hypothetical protein
MLVKDLKWIGGEHRFTLFLGELRALQEATNAGPEELLNRIRFGNWRVDDLGDTIRQGLIGGGMNPEDARRLVAGLLDRHPLLVFKPTAIEVLLSALSGPEEDKPGKSAGADESAPESGAGATSTEPA